MTEINKFGSLLRFILLSIFVVFILFRIPGTGLVYHQDEWKNANSSASVETAGAFFAHPPLMQMLFVSSYRLLGPDNLRIFPLIFFIASVFLLFVVIRNRAGVNMALWSSFLYVISFYGILGSLMLDLDGSVLPFLFLLSVYLYDKYVGQDVEKRKTYLILLTTTLLIGFLVKLSFVLVIGAILIDYLLANWKTLGYKKITKLAIGVVGFGVIYTGLLYIIQAIYPAFSISFMFGHANQYSAEEGRNWAQIIVQGVKAIYYLSPLLLIPLLFLSKEVIRKAQIFAIYLVLGVIFYFLLFDFSRGALDKYLMFSIAPLAVIVGMIISKIFKNNKLTVWSVIIGIVVSLFLFKLNFLPHSIVPLYPKSAWFAKVLHGEWNILTPFTGGSGPLGFYVSFLFMAGSFVIALFLGLIALIKKEWRQSILVIMLIVGISYNLVLAEEFIFGKINGSASKVTNEAVAYVEQDNEILKVMTYNDIDAYGLSKINKYAGRIYATPESESGYKEKFAEFIKSSGNYFLVVDVPLINPESFYGKFFSSCDPIFETEDGKIDAKVYSCKSI